MVTHVIKPNELEAVALAFSTEAEETRYYMKGVYIEANGGMVATDGHRLHTINTDSARGDSDESFILSSTDVKKAIAMAKAEMKSLKKYNKDKVKIRLTHDDGKITCAIVVVYEDSEIAKSSFTCNAVDGNFPDWRRVIPSGRGPVGEIGFNPAYMAAFGEASKLLTSSKSSYSSLALEFTGDNSPIIIRIPSTNFLGVLMPMRI